MNVHCPIDAEPAPNWTSYKSEANLWRGRMIQHFAAVEHAVSETLIRLAVYTPGKKMPHLAGQRRTALREALESSDSAGPKAGPVLDALAQFERLAHRRTFLCHGLGRLLVDEGQRWHLHLTILAPDEDGKGEVEWTVSKTVSESLLAMTNSAARRLIDRLANFRKAWMASA